MIVSCFGDQESKAYRLKKTNTIWIEASIMVGRVRLMATLVQKVSQKIKE